MAGKATVSGKGRKKAPPPPTPLKVPVKYVEGNLFRILPAHGFLANVNPEGDIFLASWYQHNAVPSEATLIINPDGSGTPLHTSKKTIGVVREIGVAFSISADVAFQLVQLIQRQLQHFSRTDRSGEQQNASGGSSE